jgi:hypothetical protein
VSGLRVLVRELAMFFGSSGVVLGLIVLAARVVMLRLMMVVRRRMMVAGRGVVVLLRRMFCHVTVFPCFEPVRPKVNRSVFPCS